MPSAAARSSEAVLDRYATGLRTSQRRPGRCDDDVEAFDADAHHVLAREAAVQSIVLLKNEGDLLPLTAGAKIAVIGEAATEPGFQGPSGSSFVNATRIDIPLEGFAGSGASAIGYAPGYSNDRASATALTDEAVASAWDADVAVVFLAAPQESEGVDRDTLDLPADRIALAEAVHRANPRTVVVLARGGVVRLAPLAGIPAIVDGALLGQGVGRGVAEILYGEANPSGRLAETVPDRIEDTPAYGRFPGVHGHVLYGEGVLVGYRWYDARRIPVTFPFGHGLSYTTFEYGDLHVDSTQQGISATVSITNTGAWAGREVAQFYVSVVGSTIFRGPRAEGFRQRRARAGRAQIRDGPAPARPTSRTGTSGATAGRWRAATTWSPSEHPAVTSGLLQQSPWTATRWRSP